MILFDVTDDFDVLIWNNTLVFLECNVEKFRP